jgi:hypothetical protein
VLRRLLIAVVALMVTACSPAPVTFTSTSPCENAGLRVAQSDDPHARLAVAFVSNVADVASWESHAYGNGSIRIFPPTSAAPLDRVDVCYYEGAFNIGGHPNVPPGGSFFPPYDILLVTVNADGVAKIATAGYRGTMPLASPPHGP